MQNDEKGRAAPVIGRAREAERRSVARLLRENGLPLEGLAHTQPLLVAREGSRLVGCVGLEHYGTAALLRSAAVVESRRGGGLGGRLVGAALREARALGVRDVYLITPSARPFFERHGFARVERDDLPEDVLSSAEFGLEVCLSAPVMHRRLDDSA